MATRSEHLSDWLPGPGEASLSSPILKPPAPPHLFPQRSQTSPRVPLTCPILSPEKGLSPPIFPAPTPSWGSLGATLFHRNVAFPSCAPPSLSLDTLAPSGLRIRDGTATPPGPLHTSPGSLVQPQVALRPLGWEVETPGEIRPAGALAGNQGKAVTGGEIKSGEVWEPGPRT